MTYESMIDDLNMDYRFFLQECSIEAIPYNALNAGATVGCIPYPINYNSLCNHLIKDGAILIENSTDVIEQFKS